MRTPKILVLDEPLSGLDMTMRNRLQAEIAKSIKSLHHCIMVSHDPSEIYRLSSRVIVLEGWAFLKMGSPIGCLG